MSNSIEIKVNINSKATHRGLERSTTLNRRYVKRPTKLIITDGTEEVEEKIESPRIEYHKTRKLEINDSEVKKEQSEAKITHIAQFNTEDTIEKATTDDSLKVKESKETEIPDIPPAPNPYQAAIDARKAQQEERKQAEISSRELKDAAIKKALAEMYDAKEESAREERIAERVMLKEMKADKKAAKSEKKAKKAAKKAEKETRRFNKKHKTGRIILAFATSAACVFALAALVKVNLPSISVKVAAVQTGVEASYPNYIPRDFSLTGIYTNDQNSVIIEFSGPDNKSFTLAEDKSSWDSNALLTNYVKGAYGTDYDTIREQGITIYINYSNATWVNNGTFYRITASNGTLSKKQLKNIAISL